jgi:hypothetical protein
MAVLTGIVPRTQTLYDFDWLFAKEAEQSGDGDASF